MSSRASGLRSSRCNVKDAYLGIDFGSVGTRLVLSWRNDEGQLKTATVECKDARFNQDSKRVNAIEFPSDCTVDGKSRLVDHDVPIDQWTSGKYLIYLLSEPIEELLKEYPVIKTLRARVNGNTQPVREALHKHFRALEKRVSEKCAARGLRVSSITASVPTQWRVDSDLVDSYRAVLAEAFGLDLTTQVMSCLESQAIAHSILGTGDGLSREIKYPPDLVVTFDLGGHSASSSIFAIGGSNMGGKGRSYFDMQLNKGAGGGCEDFLRKAINWTAGKVREKIRIHSGPWHMPTDEEMEDSTASIKLQFLKEFVGRMRKCEAEEEFFADFVFRYQIHLERESEPQICKATIDGGMLREFWHQAMEHVQRMIKEQMIQAKHQVEFHERHSDGVKPRPLFLVSGGTAIAPPIRSFLEEQCKNFGFPTRLRFAKDLDSVEYTTTGIAQGASTIGAMQITVQDFIDRGPAQLAVQMRQAGSKLWDNVARIILNGLNRTNTLEIHEFYVQTGDALQLLCRPLPTHTRVRARDEAGQENVHRGFYDLVLLESFIRCNGFLQIKAQWEGQGDNMVLVVSKRLRRGEESEESSWEACRVPVYFDPGSNCILAGRREEQWSEDRVPDFQRQRALSPPDVFEDSDVYEVPASDRTDEGTSAGQRGRKRAASKRQPTSTVAQKRPKRRAPQ